MMNTTISMMGGFGGWMWLVPVLIVAAAVWIIWRLSAGSTWSTEDRTRTEELLRERYAAGELDPDDFERRLASIHRHAP